MPETKKHGGGHGDDMVNEPVREKTNNLGFDQVRHKPRCTITEDG